MLDPRIYQNTVGMLATGISVITTESKGEIHGMTANAVTSLSLNPMLVIVCVAKKARMADLLHANMPLVINILRADQTQLSNHFAGSQRRPEVSPEIRFVSWEGGPRLQDCLAAIGCVVSEIIEGGDHWIIIGEVTALHEGGDGSGPLIYYRSRYARLEPHSMLAPGRDDLAEGPAQIFYDPW